MTAILAVAVAVSLLAYVLAYLTPAGPSPVSFVIAGGLFLVTLPTRAIRWDGSAARFVRPVRLFLILLLVATAALTILSRQVYLLYDHVAERFGFVLGDLLAVLALLFFHGRRHWAVASSLLPACVGLLVLAGLNPRTSGFLPLAAVAAMALWAWAILSGGPRRRGLAFVLFALTGAGLAAATTLFLPWAAPHVVRFVMRAYEEGQTGLSDRSELGEFRKLALSKRQVARVFTREPIRRPLLLRLKVFDHFDGRRWTSLPLPTRTLPPSGSAVLSPGSPLAEVPGSTFELVDRRDGSSSDPSAVEARVLLSLGFDDGWGLLVPAGTSRVRLPGESIKVDAFGQVFTPDGLPGVYGAASSGLPVASDGPSSNDLQAPTLPGEVGQLVASLGPPAASDAEKLERTIAFLHARPFRYTLEVGAFRTKAPLAEFLLEKKAGYCEYFASAAAILLRLQGVPTRFVKGVSVRAENAVAGHHVVRESDAHSWIVAFIPGQAWVEADPTPPGDYAALHASSPPGFFEEKWEGLQAGVASGWAWVQAALARVGATIQKAWAEGVEAVRRRPEFVVVGVLLAALLAVSPRLRHRLHRWLRDRRDRRRAEAAREVVPPGLRAMLARVEGAWARAGWPRPPSRGLREHLRGLPPQGLNPDARAVSEAVVDCYYRTAFGSHSPSAQELAGLESRLGKA